MTNKEIATTFLKMAALGKTREAYERFTSPNFKHHNQYFKGDRDSLMQAMEEAHKESPNKAIEFKHVYEDGSCVITHSKVVPEKPGAPYFAVVHISRIEDGRIVEFWDLGQVVDPNSPNENGPF